ncbi:MAG: hypothetical protein AB7T06_19880 [Kofleriaceae bacterium]
MKIETAIALAGCLLVAACGSGLRQSPEGTYRSSLSSFTFGGDGTFEYESHERPLRLVGTWTSTLEVEIVNDDTWDDQSRGHVDLLIESIETDGEPGDVFRNRNGMVVYRVGDANLGWWVHHPDGAIQENEMTIEHNLPGESRSPFAAGYTAWYANPE